MKSFKNLLLVVAVLVLGTVASKSATACDYGQSYYRPAYRPVYRPEYRPVYRPTYTYRCYPRYTCAPRYYAPPSRCYQAPSYEPDFDGDDEE